MPFMVFNPSHKLTGDNVILQIGATRIVSWKSSEIWKVFVHGVYDFREGKQSIFPVPAKQ